MPTKQPNPARTCTCSLCGLTAVSIPDKRHRRCGGVFNAPPLKKRMWAKTAGMWR